MKLNLNMDENRTKVMAGVAAGVAALFFAVVVVLMLIFGASVANSPAQYDEKIDDWSVQKVPGASAVRIIHNGKVVITGSSFGIDELDKIGVPKRIQALLMHSTVDKLPAIKKAQSQPINPRDTIPCDASASVMDIGYENFDQVKTNGQWALDDAAMKLIRAKLNSVIGVQNSGLGDDAKIICVSANPNPDAQVLNPNVNVVTSWQVVFFTAKAQQTTHDMTFTTDMDWNQTVTLDGQPT